jgi:hypothetical protein
MRCFKIISCCFCMFVTMATSSINTPTHSAGEANNSPVIPQDSLSSAIDSNEVGTDKVNNEQDKKVEVDSSPPPTTERGAQFWAIIATLCVIGLLSALENTVVTTSLSYIVTELSLGENYVWVTNVFFLTRFVENLFLIPRPEIPTNNFGHAIVLPYNPYLANWPISSGGDGSPWPLSPSSLWAAASLVALVMEQC